MESLSLFAAQYKHVLVIFHVLSVVIGMGCALVTDVLFVYFALNKKLSFQEIKILRLLSQIVLYALMAIILTGSFLFLSNPEKYLSSAKFLTKISIIGILAFNGALLHLVVFRHLRDFGYLSIFKYKTSRRVAFALGAVSLVSWVSAMSLGVLSSIPVTYAIAMAVYVGVLCLGLIFSQIMCMLYEKMRV